MRVHSSFLIGFAMAAMQLTVPSAMAAEREKGKPTSWRSGNVLRRRLTIEWVNHFPTHGPSDVRPLLPLGVQQLVEHAVNVTPYFGDDVQSDIAEYCSTESLRRNPSSGLKFFWVKP